MAELEEIIADAIVAGIAAWKKNDEAAMGAAIDRAVERITQLSASRE